MAQTEKRIDIIFGAKDQLSGKLDALDKRVSKFAKNVEKTNKDLPDFGAAFKDAAGYVALLDAAIAGIATAGVAAANELDNSASRMQASLGLPNEEAKKFKDIALDVYQGGYVSDMAEAFELVTDAQKRLGDNASVDIGKVTEQALKIKDVFGLETTETLAAVNTLMTQFGITSDEAMGFVVSGMQDGLNASGDFVDSITEYSTQFANGGATAGQFFNLMKSGLQDGMLGTDKAADAFKEFGIRIQDGSKTTRDALTGIGIDYRQLENDLGSGNLTVTDSFDKIIQKISQVDDTNEQARLGVALFGTQWEDLGRKAAVGLTTAGKSVKDLQQSLDSMDYESFARQAQSAWNTIVTQFSDLSLWDGLRAKLGTMFENIANLLPEAISNVDFGELENTFEDLFESVNAIFQANEFDLSTVDGITAMVQEVVDTVTTVLNVTKGAADAFAPFITAVVDVIKWFNDLDKSTQTIVGSFSALVLAAGPISTLMGGIGFAIGGISAPAIAAAAGIATIVKGYKEYNEMRESLNNLDSDVEIIKQGIIEKNKEELRQYTDLVSGMDKYTDAVKGLGGEIKKVTIPEKIKLELDRQRLEATKQDIQDFGTYINEMGEEITAPLESLLEYTDELGNVHYVPIEVQGDKEATKNLEEIPTEKQVEIKLKGEIDKEIARINAQADTIQHAVEWQAKLDIAEVEASAKQIEAIASSITETFKNTGEVISAGLGAIGNIDTSSGSWLYMFDAIQDQLEKENDYREQALQMQKDLTDSQTKYLDAKTDALKSGDSLIQISADGLEPELEAFMWRILERVQLRVTEEQSEFLLGM